MPKVSLSPRAVAASSSLAAESSRSEMPPPCCFARNASRARRRLRKYSSSSGVSLSSRRRDGAATETAHADALDSGTVTYTGFVGTAGSANVKTELVAAGREPVCSLITAPARTWLTVVTPDSETVAVPARLPVARPRATVAAQALPATSATSTSRRPLCSRNRRRVAACLATSTDASPVCSALPLVSVMIPLLDLTSLARLMAVNVRAKLTKNEMSSSVPTPMRILKRRDLDTLDSWRARASCWRSAAMRRTSEAPYLPSPLTSYFESSASMPPVGSGVVLAVGMGDD